MSEWDPHYKFHPKAPALWERANNADLCFVKGGAYRPRDLNALAELLADLMHWSDRESIDFDLTLEVALDHYRTESKPATQGTEL